jgi:hypothetical protein
MTIAPMNPDGIIAHVFTALSMNILGDTAAVQGFLPRNFIHTTGTGACISQSEKIVTAFMTISPEDIKIISKQDFFNSGFFFDLNHDLIVS